jgi:AmmeMemoRadiSam system protein B
LNPGTGGITIKYVEEIIALEKRIRSPVVNGLFYPEEKAETLVWIRSFGLERGKGGSARAIIAPHGAWELSGKLAAAAFGSAAGRSGDRSPSQVVLLGPIHDQQEGGVFLSDSHSFQTPLGDIPVDQEITEKLALSSSLLEINDIPHLQEHSIEVLLPFVKYCFPHASIVPILMGQPAESSISALAYALRLVFTPLIDDTLFVVSCNLAMDLNGARALGMAEECMRLFTEKRGIEFSLALCEKRVVTCGGAPVASLLQSGLVDTMRPHPVSQLACARGEENKTVYYGALSFE